MRGRSPSAAPQASAAAFSTSSPGQTYESSPVLTAPSNRSHFSRRLVWIGLDGTQIFWGAQGSLTSEIYANSRVPRNDSLDKPIGLHRDRACAVERAADPLHCARIDTEAFRNDVVCY